MVILEDKDIEKALFENGEDALVPIEVTIRNGEVEIYTFEKTYEIARQFEARFKNDPFSREAISFLDTMLKPCVEDWGYFTDDIYENDIISFIDEKIDEKSIQPTTKKLKKASKYENLTEYDLVDLPNASHECYFATVLDGKIVSICEMNTEGVFVGATEINIFTSEEYRSKGYAISNLTAMTKYLRSKGKRVAYTTRSDNYASISLAKRVGFKEIARTFYYVCYKK